MDQTVGTVGWGSMQAGAECAEGACQACLSPQYMSTYLQYHPQIGTSGDAEGRIGNWERLCHCQIKLFTEQVNISNKQCRKSCPCLAPCDRPAVKAGKASAAPIRACLAEEANIIGRHHDRQQTSLHSRSPVTTLYYVVSSRSTRVHSTNDMIQHFVLFRFCSRVESSATRSASLGDEPEAPASRNLQVAELILRLVGARDERGEAMATGDGRGDILRNSLNFHLPNRLPGFSSFANLGTGLPSSFDARAQFLFKRWHTNG